MLEIYAGLLAVNNTNVANTKVTERLETWSKNSGLQKLIP